MSELENWKENMVYDEVQGLKPNQNVHTTRWVVPEIERRKKYL